MKFTEVASFVFLALLGGAVRGEEACGGLALGVDANIPECDNEIDAYLRTYTVLAYEKECKAEPGEGDARARKVMGANVCDKQYVTCQILESYGIRMSYACFYHKRYCNNRRDEAVMTRETTTTTDAVPTPAKMTAAVGDMERAYTKASLTHNSDPDKINLNGGAIGGLTLTPGVYTFTTGVTISSDIVLEGEENSVFILQTWGVLSQAANTQVILRGGVKAQNVFWQVAGNLVVLAGATMQGTLLVKTDVAFLAGSTLIGSIFSQTACNLISATITKPAFEETCGTAAPCEYNIDPIDLGTAGDFAILAKTGISTIPTSIITGDIGVSPIAVTAITGFSLALAQNGVGWTSAQVTGKCYGPDTAAQIAAAAAVTTTETVTTVEPITDATDLADPFSEDFKDCEPISWDKFLHDITAKFLADDTVVPANVQMCFQNMFCRVKKA